jgi:hypothetical protein
MPRSHFPVRGGAYVHGRPSAGGSADGVECERCREMAAEIERLRNELARPRHGAEGAAPSRPAPAMLWAAIAICAVGLLFALAAVLRHG